MSLRLLSIVLFTFLSACASKPAANGPVSIALRGTPGTTSETRYFSRSRIKTFGEGQILRDRDEAVDFTVRTRYEAFDADTGTLKFTVTTTAKDGGHTDLHDFAFPELREEIPYVVKTTGEVLKAGRYPERGLFYVPSMPLPKTKVSVGDTWELDHIWSSARDGIPMRLQSVGILKNLVRCDKDQVCADIEISGGVSLAQAPTATGAQFANRMWGRILFHLTKGDVIWSEIRSTEIMGVKSDKMRVVSCMVSRNVDDPKAARAPLSCEPEEKPVTQVPPM